MPDPIYTHPRLAALYDAFEAGRADLDAYVELAERSGACRVVDLGCGTGSLAVRLVRPGRDVIGVDPAGESLRIARAKPGAGDVTWIEGDAAVIPPDPPADLVVMTGNAVQAVVADEAWAATLRHVRAALARSGRFVFETRRPERRAWLEWDDPEPVTVEVPGAGAVERRRELLAVDLPLVSFRHTYRFRSDGATLVSDSTLRFRGRDEIEADLRAAGLAVHDVREAPDRPGRELVVVSGPA